MRRQKKDESSKAPVKVVVPKPRSDKIHSFFFGLEAVKICVYV